MLQELGHDDSHHAAVALGCAVQRALHIITCLLVDIRAFIQEYAQNVV